MIKRKNQFIGLHLIIHILINSTIQLTQLNASFPTSFVTGRNGGQAVNIPNAGGLKAIISNLPLETTENCCNLDKIRQYNPTGGSYIFSYGNAVNGQTLV